MFQPEMRVVHTQELAAAFKQILVGIPLRTNLPDYLPPVLLGTAGEQWIERGLHLIASIGIPEDRILVSGYYEDARNVLESRVVISLQFERPRFEQEFYASPEWFDELGEVKAHLLENSVALREHADALGLTLDFRFQVFSGDVASPRHRNTVLLVEDDRFVRTSTAEVLGMHGYRVLSAETADEALAILAQHRKQIGLLFSDVSLPGEDGQRLAARVGRMDPRLPILLTSGYGRYTPTGFLRQVRFLPKPYNSEKVLRAVRESLQAGWGHGMVGGSSAKELPLHY